MKEQRFEPALGKSRQEIEAALDSHRLYAKMNRPGIYWCCRRNGRTRLWKTRPDHYSIPYKVGFNQANHIEPTILEYFGLLVSSKARSKQ